MNDSFKEQTDIQKQPIRRRYIVAAGIVLLLVLAVFVFIQFTQEVNSDLAGEKIIREEAAIILNEEPDDLTDEDFAKITEFSLMNEIPVGLGPAGEKLFMYKNIKLSDIRLLAKFVNLQKLKLIYIHYPDESTVVKVLSKAGLSNISQTKYIDLNPLQNLKTLQSLNLTQTQVSDIHALSGLVNLQELIFDSTEVSDLKPLEGLTNLQILSISNTKVSDLEPIRNLTNLQRLWLSNTEVSNIEPIKNCTNLQWLHLQDTPISDIEPLKKLINLKQLWLRDCKNITNEQIEDLQKTLPELKIQSR